MNPTFMTQKEVVRTNAVKALEYYKGNRTHTAKGLGIGIRTLQRMLTRYGMSTYLLNRNGVAKAESESAVAEAPVQAVEASEASEAAQAI